MTISLMQYLGDDGDIKILARVQKNRVSALVGRDECTIRRWRRADKYPEWAARLVAIDAGYFIWAGWDGWQVRDDRLYSPGLKYGFSPDDIESIHFLRQRCDHLERLNSAPAQYIMEL